MSAEFDALVAEFALLLDVARRLERGAGARPVDSS